MDTDHASCGVASSDVLDDFAAYDLNANNSNFQYTAESKDNYGGNNQNRESGLLITILLDSLNSEKCNMFIRIFVPRENWLSNGETAMREGTKIHYHTHITHVCAPYDRVSERQKAYVH